MNTPEFRCDVCGRTFKSSQGLAGHKRMVHEIHPPPKPDLDKLGDQIEELCSVIKSSDLGSVRIDLSYAAESSLRELRDFFRLSGPGRRAIEEKIPEALTSLNKSMSTFTQAVTDLTRAVNRLDGANK